MVNNNQTDAKNAKTFSAWETTVDNNRSACLTTKENVSSVRPESIESQALVANLKRIQWNGRKIHSVYDQEILAELLDTISVHQSTLKQPVAMTGLSDMEEEIEDSEGNLSREDALNKWKCIRLFLVGDSGAGKTSVVRWLKGDPFISEHNSTDSIDVTTADINSWKSVTFDIKDYMACITRAMVEAEVKTNFADVQTKQKWPNSSNEIPVSNILLPKYHARNLDLTSDPMVLSELISQELKERSKRMGELSQAFHVWDFAGQEEYYNTHHFFLTDDAIYLLVVDISIPVEIPRVQFWLDSIKFCSPKAEAILLITVGEQKPGQSKSEEAPAHNDDRTVVGKTKQGKMPRKDLLKKSHHRLLQSFAYHRRKHDQKMTHFCQAILGSKRKQQESDFAAYGNKRTKFSHDNYISNILAAIQQTRHDSVTVRSVAALFSNQFSTVYSVHTDGTISPIDDPTIQVRACRGDNITFASVQLWKCQMQPDGANPIQDCTWMIQGTRVAVEDPTDALNFKFNDMSLQIPAEEGNSTFILRYFLFRDQALIRTCYSSPFCFVNPNATTLNQNRRICRAVRRNLGSTNC